MHEQIIIDLDINQPILCMIQEVTEELAMVLESLWEKDSMKTSNFIPSKSISSISWGMLQSLFQ